MQAESERRFDFFLEHNYSFFGFSAGKIRQRIFFGI